MHARPFAGYKFLIIEDEMLIAWRVGDIVADLGGTVGKIAFNYEQGRDALTAVDWDCAIVDINLHGKVVFPLVAMIEQAGIPFCVLQRVRGRHHQCLPGSRFQGVRHQAGDY